MIYVIPFQQEYEKEIDKLECVTARLKPFPSLLCKTKLYSKANYPHIVEFPEHVTKVILNSDAFVLHSHHINITRDYSYYDLLTQFYFYNNSERTICVAPDVFLNPVETMCNFMRFKERLKLNNINGLNLAAVLQSDTKQNLNYEALKKQADFYSNYTDTIFLGNPGISGENAKRLRVDKLFDYMKNKLNIKWIHVLGAGWSLKDIDDWKAIKNFDSMDSVVCFGATDVESFGSLYAIQNIKNIMEKFKGEI